MAIDEGAVRANFRVHTGSPWPKFHLYSMSVPPNIGRPNHCCIALGILFDKQLKYRVPGTEEHIFEFLSPPTCVYADSLRFTTIACSTINLHSPIANALVVVIHITTSPTVLHDSPRETWTLSHISDQIRPGNCKKNNPKHYGDCHGVWPVWNPPAPQGKEGIPGRSGQSLLWFMGPVRIVAFQKTREVLSS